MGHSSKYCGPSDSKIADLQNQIDNIEHPCFKKVYTWEINSGVIEQIWTGDGNATAHDDVKNIFTGINHVNGVPDVDIIVPDFIDNTANDPSNGADQAQWIAYVYSPADGTQFQDINGNNGERFRVLVGKGCCPPTVVYESPEGDDSEVVGGVGNGAGIFTTLDKGWNKIIFQLSDNGAFAGVQLQIDDSGNGVFSDYSGPVSTTLPKLVCRNEPCDYVLSEDEFDCPQSLCAECDPIEVGGGEGRTNEEVLALVGPIPEPCDDEPISDNNHSIGEWDRNGDAGVSEEFARCDHKHPIVRIPNPGDPVLTYTGQGTLDQSLILDRLSTEESYMYKYRNLVSQDAGTGWGFINVPTIAGFQQPKITGVGTYQLASSQIQNDDGNFGASPRGPYMGKDAHEWSSTRRVYMGYFRRDNAHRTYVEFWVEYIRV